MVKCLGEKRKSLGLALPLIFISPLGLDDVQRGERQGQPDPRRALGRWFGLAIREALKRSSWKMKPPNKFRLENKQQL